MFEGWKSRRKYKVKKSRPNLETCIATCKIPALLAMSFNIIWTTQRWVYICIWAWNLTSFGLWIETFTRQCNLLAARVLFLTLNRKPVTIEESTELCIHWSSIRTKQSIKSGEALILRISSVSARKENMIQFQSWLAFNYGFSNKNNVRYLSNSLIIVSLLLLRLAGKEVNVIFHRTSFG